MIVRRYLAVVMVVTMMKGVKQLGQQDSGYPQSWGKPVCERCGIVISSLVTTITELKETGNEPAITHRLHCYLQTV